MKTLLALALASVVSQLLGGAPHRETEKGNADYAAKDWKAARERYEAAAKAAPDAPEVPYNLGNVTLREDDPDQAVRYYEQALRNAPAALAPQAAFNLGNALFRQQKYEEAVRAYRKALQAAPKDPDGKRNLELAQRALQVQQQQQQQQQQRKQEQQQRKQEQQQPREGGGSENEPKPQPSPGDEPKPGDEKQDPRPQPRPKPGDMSEEQAKQMLDRLAEIERQNQRKGKDKDRRGLVRGGGTPEKDW